MRAAIALDAWKLDIFERHLAKSGYQYERSWTSDGISFLSVETDNVVALHEVVQAANVEAAGVGTRQ
jgi:hypothetical protein